MSRSTADIPAQVKALRRFFETGATRDVSFRSRQLKALGSALRAREQPLLAALHADLGKSTAEAYASELALVLSEIDHVRRHLNRWARPTRRRLPLLCRPGTGRVLPEPYGVVLAISPWNYPLQLALSPLVSAIAAGNVVCVKPSEHAPATARCLAELVRATFAPDYVALVEGDAETAKALLRERFDYIFFTGSTAVGRAVMHAAADHLTPVTLELGGKSPCIVCGDADLRETARRIAWGKWANAGQTCVAPDYVLADAAICDPLVEMLCAAARERYGPDPQQHPDYGRIVNDRHLDRLCSYLAFGDVVHGGECDRAGRYLAPTVMTRLTPDSPPLREEIFGPILPVLPFDTLEDAIAITRRCDPPLALYIFSRDRGIQHTLMVNVRSGGVCINDTLLHVSCHNLPFGGIGASGMGVSNGHSGFMAFSHPRSVLTRPAALDLPWRHLNPPALRIFRPLMRLLLRS